MNDFRSAFEDYVDRLGPDFAGRLSTREAMKRHTTFKIGGPAAVMAWPRDRADLEAALARAEEMGLPWRVLGEGSNLLVGDAGVSEIVINFGAAFQERELEGAEDAKEGDDLQATLGAGLKLIKAIKDFQQSGVAGLEWAAGIPGSAGGAVVMNAGSLGADMASIVAWVKWRRGRDGEAITRRPELTFGYRRLERPARAIVLACGLKLKKDDPRAVRERIVKGLRRRRQTQPLSYPSAGSVFKNPPGDFAGRLIEAVGLKGKRLGDAQISDLHANFIVNRGRARSRDARQLIELARAEVAKATGIELELELELVGEELT